MDFSSDAIEDKRNSKWEQKLKGGFDGKKPKIERNTNFQVERSNHAALLPMQHCPIISI